jgi:negative regulator of sigma E activity
MLIWSCNAESETSSITKTDSNEKNIRTSIEKEKSNITIRTKKQDTLNALKSLKEVNTTENTPNPSTEKTWKTDFNPNGKVPRKVENEVLPSFISDYDGKTVFNLCINRSGSVIYLKYNKEKSTLTNRAAVSDAMAALKKTTFEKNSSGAPKDCGQWAFNFKRDQ